MQRRVTAGGAEVTTQNHVDSSEAFAERIPEYRPPHAYPTPEPHNAGNDSTDTTRTLLATADEIIFSQRDEIRVLDEALGESWSLIRELRAQLDAQSEQIAALTEFAEAQVKERELEQELASGREAAQRAERRAS